MILFVGSSVKYASTYSLAFVQFKIFALSFEANRIVPRIRRWHRSRPHICVYSSICCLSLNSRHTNPDYMRDIGKRKASNGVDREPDLTGPWFNARYWSSDLGDSYKSEIIKSHNWTCVYPVCWIIGRITYAVLDTIFFVKCAFKANSTIVSVKPHTSSHRAAFEEEYQKIWQKSLQFEESR